jgi:hypothetical protein
MDIKGFISSNLFEHNIEKIIHNENKILKKSHLENPLELCYDISELEFIDMKNIFEIKLIQKFIDFINQNEVLIKKENISISGPQIKKLLSNISDENLIIPDFYITLIDHDYRKIEKIENILNEQENCIFKNNMIGLSIDNYNYYIILNYQSYPCKCLLQHDLFNRIMWYQDKIYVSQTFLITLFERLKIYEPNLQDPIFKIHQDIYQIRKIVKNSIESKNIKIDLIDKIDIDKINKLLDDNINVINEHDILYRGIMINIFEYIIIKLGEEKQKHLNNQYRKLILNIIWKINDNNFIFIRPPNMISQYIHLEQIYPAIYDEIINLSSKICVELNDEYNNDVNVINNLCIEEIIKKDDGELFVLYTSKIHMIKKFKTPYSKSLETIIHLIIKYIPKNIISCLIELDLLSDYYKYRIILMTEQLQFFDEELLEKIMKKDIDDIMTSEQKNIISKLLIDVINNGLTRSFYIITKLQPKLITTNMDILFDIENEKSRDILEIIFKKIPKMVNHKNNNSKTLLMHYSEKGYGNLVLLLLKYKVKYYEVDSNGENFLHYLVRYNQRDVLYNVINFVQSIINDKNDNQETPILLASKLGNEDMFYLLNDNNANLLCSDIYGNMPYHYICLNKICIGIMIKNIKNKFDLTPKDYCSISHKYYHFIN